MAETAKILNPHKIVVLRMRTPVVVGESCPAPKLKAFQGTNRFYTIASSIAARSEGSQ